MRTHEGAQIYPYLGPQLRAVGLIKYGAVKVVSHAPRNPRAEANPKVYDLSRCEGNSPPATQAYEAIRPYKKSVRVQQKDVNKTHVISYFVDRKKTDKYSACPDSTWLFVVHDRHSKLRNTAKQQSSDQEYPASSISRYHCGVGNEG